MKGCESISKLLPPNVSFGAQSGHVCLLFVWACKVCFNGKAGEHNGCGRQEGYQNKVVKEDCRTSAPLDDLSFDNPLDDPVRRLVDRRFWTRPPCTLEFRILDIKW